MERQIAAIAPEDAPGFRRFLEENRAKLHRMLPCLENPFLGWHDVVNMRMLKTLPILRPHQSMDTYLAHFFRDARIRLAFSFQSKYLGMSPFRCILVEPARLFAFAGQILCRLEVLRANRRGVASAVQFLQTPWLLRRRAEFRARYHDVLADDLQAAWLRRQHRLVDTTGAIHGCAPASASASTRHWFAGRAPGKRRVCTPRDRIHALE